MVVMLHDHAIAKVQWQGLRRLRLGRRLAKSPGVPTHGVYLGRERGRLNDRRASPRGHRQKTGVIGHHNERSGLGSKVECQVVLMPRTVMVCPGHLIQDATAAVLLQAETSPHMQDIAYDWLLGGC